jgi:cell division ATPase FtsA
MTRKVPASSIPVTADHFTRDIAWMLKVDYEDEILGRTVCHVGLTAESTLIEIPRGKAVRRAKPSAS